MNTPAKTATDRAVPTTPGLDDPIGAIREAQFAERQLVRLTETWLREQSFPMQAVQWVPHWNRARAVVTKDVAHLAELIFGLEPDDWGGIQRRSNNGRRRAWAQVRRSLDDHSYLVELWPEDDENASGPMLFDRALDLRAGGAAALAWAWVRGDRLPAHKCLEPRVLSPGQMADRAL